MNPKTKGNLCEAAMLTRLIALGYTVSLPFGDNARYDIIYDDGQKLIRAQVKHGRVEKGNVHFNAYSTSGGRGRRDYRGVIDVFLVFCPELGTHYEIPVERANRSETVLRNEAPGNGQKIGVLWARDFLI